MTLTARQVKGSNHGVISDPMRRREELERNVLVQDLTPPPRPPEDGASPRPRRAGRARAFLDPVPDPVPRQKPTTRFSNAMAEAACSGHNYGGVLWP